MFGCLLTYIFRLKNETPFFLYFLYNRNGIFSWVNLALNVYIFHDYIPSTAVIAVQIDITVVIEAQIRGVYAEVALGH